MATTNAAQIAKAVDDFYSADHEHKPDGSHYWSTGDGDRGEGTTLRDTEGENRIEISYKGAPVAFIDTRFTSTHGGMMFVLGVLNIQAHDEETGAV